MKSKNNLPTHMQAHFGPNTQATRKEPAFCQLALTLLIVVAGDSEKKEMIEKVLF